VLNPLYHGEKNLYIILEQGKIKKDRFFEQEQKVPKNPMSPGGYR